MSIEVTQEDRDAAAEAFAALCDEPPILACEFLAPYFAAYRARIEAAATAKVRERWSATFRVKANEAAALARDARDQGRQIAQAALNAESDAWKEAAELLDQLEKGA